VIPVEDSGATHVFHGEGTVEVLANVTTDILLEHESATWMMEVILSQVDNEVINDGDVMTSFDHLHVLVVGNFCWWRFEWNFSSAIQLEPNFEKQNETCEPSSADNIHAEVEAGEHTSLSANHEAIANKHMQLSLLDSVPRVPLGRSLNLFDHNTVEHDKHREEEQWQDNPWM
jgi:hypothetical protein